MKNILPAHHVSVVACDDDEMHLEILLKTLLDAGFDAKGFGDGSDAWAYMKSNPDHVDIAILDKMMPIMDGGQVVEHMKEHHLLRDTAVIMQTADTRQGKQWEALQEGIHFYLTKPYDPRDLIKLLKAAIRQRERLRGQTRREEHEIDVFFTDDETE